MLFVGLAKSYEIRGLAVVSTPVTPGCRTDSESLRMRQLLPLTPKSYTEPSLPRVVIPVCLISIRTNLRLKG